MKRYSIIYLALAAAFAALLSCTREPAPVTPGTEAQQFLFRVGMSRTGSTQTPVKALRTEVGTLEENTVKHLWAVVYSPSAIVKVFHFTPQPLDASKGFGAVTAYGALEVVNYPLGSPQTTPGGELLYTAGPVNLQPSAVSGYEIYFAANTRLPGGEDAMEQYLNSALPKTRDGLRKFFVEKKVALIPESATAARRQPVTHRELSAYSVDGMFASNVVAGSSLASYSAGNPILLYRRVARLRVKLSNVRADGEIYTAAKTSRITSLALVNHYYKNSEAAYEDVPLSLDAFSDYKNQQGALPTLISRYGRLDLAALHANLPLFSGTTRDALFPGIVRFYDKEGAFESATGTTAEPYAELFDIYIPSDMFYDADGRSTAEQMALRMSVRHGNKIYNYTIPIGTGSGVSYSPDLDGYGWFLRSGEFNSYSILRNFLYELKLTFSGVDILEVIAEGQKIQYWTDDNGWYED